MSKYVYSVSGVLLAIQASAHPEWHTKHRCAYCMMNCAICALCLRCELKWAMQKKKNCYLL